jgi:NADH dehydrogenase FAD-containing subunit
MAGPFDHGRLTTGQTVLIHGAAGGVGSLAVQLAREMGARVIGTGRAADKDTALGLGADAFLDLQSDHLEDAGEADVVFDVIGGDVLDRSAAVVRAGGTLVTIATPPKVQPRDGRAVFFVVEPDRARLADLARAADAVRIPLQDVLAGRVRFVQTEINGFGLDGRRLLTGAGPIGWRRLVLALGSRPNDFAIPGLAERTLSVYSASDAERVWAAVGKALDAAAAATDPERQRRLATVVVGGGGCATGVELAGELAEVLPEVASRHGLAPDRPAVRLIETGPTILAGSSPQLIDKATKILSDLGVQVRTNAAIAAATEEGFRLEDGQLVEGGVFVWAGGVKAPELVADSGLPTGHNGRVKVDRYLRVLDHPEIYVAGDLASVTDPQTGHVLPPLAQVALRARRWPATWTRSWRAGRWRRSPSTTRGSSSRSGPAAGSPTSSASPPAATWPTCSKTPSSGSTASPSSTCAAGTQ